MYLSLYCKGSKRITQSFTVRGSWRPNWYIYIDPHSYGRQRCVFLGSPGAQLSAECWVSLPHLVTNGSLKLLGAPRAPSTGSGFHYHILSATLWTPTVWLPVLTELYNNSTPTQSPTQSLEWHVWSSSNRNKCHAVQRSLSSGASVYECIMGFLPCPISSAKFAHVISFDYWPLECVTSFRCITLEWQVCPGRRSKYNNIIFWSDRI